MENSAVAAYSGDENSKKTQGVDSIYFETLIDKKVVVEPKYLTANNDEYILGKLKKRYEGKCLKEGHIKDGSIEIVVKGVGLLEGSHFTGDITYNIRFRALVCKPVIGNLIEFEVKVINQVGPRGILGPIQITVPREIHDEMEMKALSKVKVGDMIRVRVITTHYTPSSTNIRVVAKMDVSAPTASKKGAKKGTVTGTGNDFVTSDALDDDVDEEMENLGEEGLSEDEEEISEGSDGEEEDEEASDAGDIELSDSEDELGDAEGEGEAGAALKKASFSINKQTGEEGEESEDEIDDEEFNESGNESDVSDA